MKNLSIKLAQVKSPTLAEIKRLHSEIESTASTLLDKAIRIGELLTEEKSRLAHGQWLPWLETNVTFTDRTARNYIRLFDERDRLKLESVSDLTSAYRLLAPPTPPHAPVTSAAPQHEPDPEADDDFIVEVAVHIFHTRGHTVTLGDILTLKNQLVEHRKQAA